MSRVAPSDFIGFFKAFKAASWFEKRGRMTIVAKFSPSGHDAASTGYPLPGCSPAEPNSVSPEA